MNDKYGIELELITNKFNEKMQAIKNTFKGAGQELKEMFNPETEINKYTAQLEYLERQIKNLTSKKEAFKLKTDYNGVLKTEAQIEKLKNKYNELLNKQNEIGTSSKTMTSSLQSGFSKLSSKIKKFGLSLFGIRSIFSLISKASSAYLSQDTALANKLQSVWAGLGAMLAPIIEGIANILAKAVKYINIFIKALTGVDLLARATSKSLGSMAKNAKASNKALAGFDELTNLDSDVGSGIDIGLKDVEVNTTWADRIRQFGEWVKANKPLIIGLFVGIGTAIATIKIAKLITAFSKLKTVFSGLGKIFVSAGTKLKPLFDILKNNMDLVLGIGLIITGIVYTIDSLLKYLKDATWSNFGKIIQGVGVAIVGLGVTIASVPVAVAGAIVLIVGTITKYWEQIKSFLQGGIDWLVGKTDWVREHFGVVGETIYTIFTSLLQGLLDIFDSIFTAIKGVFDGIINFFKGVFTGEWKQAWEGIKEIFSSIWNGIKGIVMSVVNVIKSILQGLWNTIKYILDGIWGAVKSVINAITGAINVLIRGINKISFDVPDWVPGLGGKKWGFNLPQIPQLAVGTNYVPEDQLAYIHKGEAVVPKKFNSQEYFGNNEEVSSKLDRVIEAIQNIEINPHTSIDEVGKASLKWINNRSRQLGESVVM